MTINVREVGGVTILDLDGRLSVGDDVRELEAQVKQLLAERKLKLLVNLDKVSYVDSSGVGILVRCLTSAKAAGGDLKLVKPNKVIREIVKATNLVKILGVFDNEEEAIASFA
ncbi:MAG: STAS domain-containing protein [Nitrospiraceae bacterium]